MSVYLGLDLGTTMGRAIVGPGELSVGTWSMRKKGENDGAMLVRFHRNLAQVNPTAIGYERIDFRQKSIRAAAVYHAQRSKLEEYCELHDVALFAFSVADIKKRATGRGNARKEAVKARAEMQLGRALDKHDAADAFWVLVLLLEELRTGQK